MSERRRAVLAAASARLRAAGVASPEHDARALLGHVVGIDVSRLMMLDEVGERELAAYDALLIRRASREPLQHLTGEAWFRRVRLEVGPGVFVPRPETELLAGWAIAAAQARVSTGGSATVVDLATGSGAIALALVDEAPGADVHAVELDPAAYAWAERNLADAGVDLRYGDLATAFDDLLGAVDVVVSNPPYVPLEAWESVAPEARDHDPHLALFSGADGLDTIRVLAVRAALLLRIGGVLGVEHADAQGEAVPAVLSATGRWAEVRDHPDLAGRSRFTTARLAR